MGNASAKILLIGLDNSGKTTLLSRLIDPDSMDLHITPTIGYQKKTFSRNNIDFEVYDMSGQSKYRDLWQSNASNSNGGQIHGIIFVVDCSDKMRLNVARSELEMILENEYIPKHIPYLFYANKSDIKGSTPLQQVENILKLSEIAAINKIYACSALKGTGIQDGILWFCDEIKLIMN